MQWTGSWGTRRTERNSSNMCSAMNTTRVWRKIQFYPVMYRDPPPQKEYPSKDLCLTSFLRKKGSCLPLLHLLSVFTVDIKFKTSHTWTVLQSHQVSAENQDNFFLYCNIRFSNEVSLIYSIRGASKIKLKNVNKKRMATARRLIFFGISQGIYCWSDYTVFFIVTKLWRRWRQRQKR